MCQFNIVLQMYINCHSLRGVGSIFFQGGWYVFFWSQSEYSWQLSVGWSQGSSAKQAERDWQNVDKLDYLKVDTGSRSEIVMYWSHLQPAWQWELFHKPRYLQAELCNPLGWGALEQHKEESHTTCSAGALVLWNGTWWPGQNLSALGYLKANDNSTQRYNRSRSILSDHQLKYAFTFFIQ